MQFKLSRSQEWLNWLTVAIGFITTKAAVAFIGLGLTIILPLILPIEDVGKVYLIISLISILTTFQRFGIDYLSLNKGLNPENKSTPRSIYVSSLYSMISLNIIVGIPIYYIIYYLFSGLKGYGYIANSMPAIIIWSLSLSTIYILFQMYKVIGKPLQATMTRSFYQNAFFILFLLLSLAFNLNLKIDDVFIIFSFSTLLVALVNSVHFMNTSKGHLSIDLNPRQVITRAQQSTIFFVYSLALIICSEIDIWLVAYFFGPTEVAIYATSKRLMLLVSIFTDFSNIILPKKLADLLKQDRIKEGQKLLRRFALIFSILSAVIIILFAVFGPWAIALIYGEKMAGVYKLLLVLLIAQAAVLMIGSAETVLLIKRDPSARLILVLSALTGALVQVIFTIFTSGSIGVIAIPLGVLINVIFFRLGLMVTVRRRYHILTFMGW